MHLTQSVQTCIIKGCDGFYVPDITGRTMCYKCGPRDMLPAFMPPIRNYGDSSFDLSKSVKGTEFKDVPQSIIDEVDKICRPKDGLYEKWKEVEKAASLESEAAMSLRMQLERMEKAAYKEAFPPKITGQKYDADKLRWHLMPWDQLHQVALVMEHGANKYGEENWKLVVGAHPRYFDAAMRHIVADQASPGSVDAESGISHLAHAVCCLLFMMYFEEVRNAQSASPSGL